MWTKEDRQDVIETEKGLIMGKVLARKEGRYCGFIIDIKNIWKKGTDI